MEINNKGTKMSEKIESETPIIKAPTFSVTLSIYDWHKLLKELEFLRQICNRDQDKVVDLWENIATQLSGKEQIVNGSWKHHQLRPDDFPKQVPPVIPSKVVEEPKKKVSWWKKFKKENK